MISKSRLPAVATMTSSFGGKSFKLCKTYDLDSQTNPIIARDPEQRANGNNDVVGQRSPRIISGRWYLYENE